MQLQTKEMLEGLPVLTSPPKYVCEGCVLGKMARQPFPKILLYELITSFSSSTVMFVDPCAPLLLVVIYTLSSLLMTILSMVGSTL